MTTQLARFRQNRAAVVGAVIVGLVLVAAVLAPLLAPHDPLAKNVYAGLGAVGEPLGPSLAYPLGTDSLGRCVLSRILYGARISLLVAFLATFIATVLGTAVGLCAGYLRGWVDAVAMRLVDLILSFPFLLLVIALASVFREAGLVAVLVVLGVSGWTTVARVVRGKVLAVRELDYVSGARAIGAGDARVIWRHVLPNVLGPVVVTATVSVAQMILIESTLAFLGLGVPPPAATWGRMLFEGQSFLVGAPWMAFAPGAALLLTVLGFNLLGDGLRDALDPKERR